ncbi:TetR/AcrR family transcriptional regulator [Gordonia sp. PP30]|uniref:TetR/AcrR family transcriptional regulator n=1 Tax=Gordonia sp. PP30 TaxID=2935861 RepID=UPI001FFE8A0A|nr:TetR/AcrR family transcriptional regulator [Gordonia sp. PP30]UQE75264.1 TetR/AcrR family transcriptional regulator [Gordonia sp. PP30]
MAAHAGRRRMSAADRREQILDVAHRIVVDEGFTAATPTRIAAAADVHRSLLYQQFGDVPGLFVALIERERSRAAQQFAAAVAGAAGRGAARLSAVLAAMIGAVDDAPGTWRLFLVPPEGAPPEYHAQLAASQAVVQQYLTATLAGLGPELVRDPELTARVLQAAGREVLQFRLFDPESATTERLLAFAARAATAFPG